MEQDRREQAGGWLKQDRHVEHLEVIAGNLDSLLVARRSLRRLVDEAWALSNEAVLHTARLNAQMFAGLGDQKLSDADILHWLESPPLFLAEEAPRFERLLDSGYLGLRPFDRL